MNPIVKVVDGVDVVNLVLNEGATIQDAIEQADIAAEDDTLINGVRFDECCGNPAVNGITLVVTEVSDLTQCRDMLTKLNLYVAQQDNDECLCGLVGALECACEEAGIDID